MAKTQIAIQDHNHDNNSIDELKPQNMMKTQMTS